MKLYAWKPAEEGWNMCFFVIANSEKEALELVEKKIDALPDMDKFSCSGFGTGAYILTVADPGVVVTAND